MSSTLATAVLVHTDIMRLYDDRVRTDDDATLQAARGLALFGGCPLSLALLLFSFARAANGIPPRTHVGTITFLSLARARYSVFLDDASALFCRGGGGIE